MGCSLVAGIDIEADIIITEYNGKIIREEKAYDDNYCIPIGYSPEHTKEILQQIHDCRASGNIKGLARAHTDLCILLEEGLKLGKFYISSNKAGNLARFMCHMPSKQPPNIKEPVKLAT
jgi:hypothetical protein